MKELLIAIVSTLCALVLAITDAEWQARRDENHAVIVLGAEDELCIDVIYDDASGQLTAEVWRGDPDTCEPIG